MLQSEAALQKFSEAVEGRYYNGQLLGVVKKESHPVRSWVTHRFIAEREVPNMFSLKNELISFALVVLVVAGFVTVLIKL